MRYKDGNYNLEEYFNKVMEELGFTEGVEKAVAITVTRRSIM